MMWNLGLWDYEAMLTWWVSTRVEFNPGWDSTRYANKRNRAFTWQSGSGSRVEGWKKLKNACKQFNPGWKDSLCTLQDPFSKNCMGSRKRLVKFFALDSNPPPVNTREILTRVGFNPGRVQSGCHVNKAWVSHHPVQRPVGIYAFLSGFEPGTFCCGTGPVHRGPGTYCCGTGPVYRGANMTFSQPTYFLSSVLSTPITWAHPKCRSGSVKSEG